MQYISVAIEGGLFPVDILDRIAAGDSSLPGQKASDFGLDGSRRITDETQSAFSDARSYWDAFQRRLERSRESRTTITREDWVTRFLELLGFENLVVQRSSAEVGSERYFISHRADDYPEATPIHIVSIDQELDRRDGGRRSPHGLVQDFLNQSDALWGIATNGRRLRLLRNSSRISKPAYMEFNLEGMLEGNLYSEFVLLYRLLHVSRFPKENTDAHECLLEKYYQTGLDQGGRVREKLRGGVEEALKILGTAFLAHPKSAQLRNKFETKALSETSYYRQLLHLVYRILFLMVSEERKLIFSIEETVTERQFIYSQYYSIARLRDRADRYFTGDRNVDLWLGLSRTFRILGDNDEAKELGLSALNGELFSHQSCPDIETANCTNEELLRAVRELSTFLDERNIRRRVHYAGLDVEEFGSVYESLLDFHPKVSIRGRYFELVSGSERKQTGSYYTPPELVHELIKSSLVPVIEDRLRGLKLKEEKEEALLGLRVCDPASGSGHFLLAAARRIARELGTVRNDGQEPSTDEYRHAIRDVIRNCIYAVDKNPLAIDLCKVALWIESHSVGLPLSFLDHHIKCGDSLVGVADLKVLVDGIPDDAYKPVIGDDRQAAAFYKKRNQAEKKSRLQLSLGESVPVKNITDTLADDFKVLGTLEEHNPDEVNAKENLYNSLRGQDSDWWKLKVACDLWTSAFFLPMKSGDGFQMKAVPTSADIRNHLETNSADGRLIGQAAEVSEKNSFFHWPIEFPDVFEYGGFDMILGNPPWDKVEMKEVEFFEYLDSEIAHLSGTRRKKAIADLEEKNHVLWLKFTMESRRIECVGKFSKESGRFPLTATGRMNFFALFAETDRRLLNSSGRMGVIVPTSIGTDHTFRQFFGDMVSNRSLVAFYDFENREGIFPAVDRRYRFCLLTVSGNGSKRKTIEFAFFIRKTQQLTDDNYRFTLTSEDIAHINPNTKTCPVFRSKRDAELAKKIHKLLPIMVNNEIEQNCWDLVLMADLINMSHDSGSFFTEPGPDLFMLYEGKMVQSYDHRASSVRIVSDNLNRAGQPVPTSLSDHQDPGFRPQPEYWVHRDKVLNSLQRIGVGEISGLLAYKCVTSPTNERTMIASILPFSGVAHSLNVVYPKEDYAKSIVQLLGNFNSYACDYLVRQKIGGVNLSLFLVEQLPIIKPSTFDQVCPWLQTGSIYNWIVMRILELVYTSWDMKTFVEELGHQGAPFIWDEKRRFLLRCELDAAFFHLYEIESEDVDYIMDTFPIVKRKDEDKYGKYRTKRVILEIYDEMAESIRTGEPYQTRLDPPPADPRVAHPSERR